MDKNKSLIKSLLTGKLTKSQRKEFADLECVDREIRTQWKESGKRNVNNQIKQQIWNSIKVKCKHTKSYQVLVEPKWYLIAASFAILLAIGGLLINFYENRMKDELIKVIAQQSKMYILPDSTKVWMEAGSTIQYARAFNHKRAVWLEGNSLFEVTKRRGENFRVYINKAFIEVKGTCFQIKQNSESQNEITLMSGKIDFNIETTNECIPVKPMQRIIYNPQKGKIHINEFTKLHWKDGKFYLNDMSLTQLTQTINQLYNTNITLKDNVRKESAFTGTIRYDEPLTDVLTKICYSLNLNIDRANDQIIIY